MTPRPLLPITVREMPSAAATRLTTSEMFPPVISSTRVAIANPGFPRLRTYSSRRRRA